MPIKPGKYVNPKSSGTLKWTHPKGEPAGVEETLLHRFRDGSYSHVLRVKAGVEFPEPVVHDFYEEAYYIEGEMVNTKTRARIRAGTYVFHKPGEKHGPFKCLRACLILEFRYYK